MKSDRELLVEAIVRDAKSIDMIKKGELLPPSDLDFYIERYESYKKELEEMDRVEKAR